MTSLITGARGFAGAWLAAALLERGEGVVALDRPAPRDAGPSTLDLLGIRDEVSAVEGDLRAEGAAARAIDQHRVDTVFHLAAETIVGAAAASPVNTFETNVRGTWLLLDACRRRGVEKVVVASSDKAYGSHSELPYREDVALRPSSPYEASKAAAELIARSYWHSYGLPVAVIRCANIYGGGDGNWSRLIPEVVTAVLDGRAPVLRSDGSPERDFLYVEDAASAYLAIADRLDRDGIRGEAFNAGGGHPHAVREVVELIISLAGSTVSPEVLGSGNPDGEIEQQWVDTSKLAERTGWRPAVGLKEGLRRTIEWYREHPQTRPP
jgi:CDP-glucose 4,6-dehydratase